MLGARIPEFQPCVLILYLGRERESTENLPIGVDNKKTTIPPPPPPTQYKGGRPQQCHGYTMRRGEYSETICGASTTSPLPRPLFTPTTTPSRSARSKPHKDNSAEMMESNLHGRCAERAPREHSVLGAPLSVCSRYTQGVGYDFHVGEVSRDTEGRKAQKRKIPASDLVV